MSPMQAIIVLLTVSSTLGFPDKNTLAKARKALITSKNAGENGPDEAFVNKLVEGIETLRFRRMRSHRKSSEKSVVDMEEYRRILGPRGNHTESDAETHPDVADFTLEGDIVLNPEQIEKLLGGGENESRQKRALTTDPATHWDPAKPIYWTLDSSLCEFGEVRHRTSERSLILEALQFWQDNTCLTFVENPNGKNRLRFFRGSGCWSYYGKQTNWNSQDISIGYGCTSLGIVCHEIGHALGLYHTQSRYDRDDSITVNFANIISSLQYNFDKMTPATETHFGMPYDYGSVMQYSPYSFAVNANIPTIVAKDIRYQNTMGQRERPSFSDIVQLNKLYCKDQCSSTQCENSGTPKPGSSECICPTYFSGTKCEQLNKGSSPVCNGQIVQATTATQTLNATGGYENNFSWHDDLSDCFWIIKAPSDRKIRFSVKQITTTCQESCYWAAFEINPGNIGSVGMLTCCPSIENTVFISDTNIVAIRSTSRYNSNSLLVQYSLA